MSRRLEERYGKFTIPADLVHNHQESILLVMGTVIVLRCEYNFVTNIFEYEAWSPSFERVSFGEIPPQYTLTVSSDEEGVKGVRWERVS